jgi:hypothetical protein
LDSVDDFNAELFCEKKRLDASGGGSRGKNSLEIEESRQMPKYFLIFSVLETEKNLVSKRYLKQYILAKYSREHSRN